MKVISSCAFIGDFGFLGQRLDTLGGGQQNWLLQNHHGRMRWMAAHWEVTMAARLLRWILFSILILALTSLVLFLVFVWLRIILLAVF